MLAIWFLVPLPFLCFPGCSDSKVSAWNAGDLGSILGQEDPLDKEMATHSSTLAWKIPWTEEADRLQTMGSQRVRPDWVTSLSSFLSAFSKSSLNIWKLLIPVLLKPHLENFEHYFGSVWDKGYCAIVWIFFDIAFLLGWNENWHFLLLVPLLRLPNLLTLSAAL